MNLKNSVGRLRLLSIIEGISTLFLFFIAMPLKYIWNQPELVSIAGRIHGGLFVALVIYAIMVGIEKEWTFKGVTGKVILGSIVPFGPFIVDKKVLKNLD